MDDYEHPVVRRLRMLKNDEIGRALRREEDRRRAESDPGDYYRRKDEDARRLAAELDEARKRGAPAKDIQRLEEALERARYVGD